MPKAATVAIYSAVDYPAEKVRVPSLALTRGLIGRLVSKFSLLLRTLSDSQVLDVGLLSFIFLQSFCLHYSGSSGLESRFSKNPQAVSLTFKAASAMRVSKNRVEYDRKSRRLFSKSKSHFSFSVSENKNIFATAEIEASRNIENTGATNFSLFTICKTTYSNINISLLLC